MLFSKTKTVNSYMLKLDGNTINPVKYVKCIGLLIDENIDWYEPINNCKP